jgi:uncharacterized protein
MEMAGKILEHAKFIKYMKRNTLAEKKRKFCRHDLQHALDVARVAYIISLEKGCNVSKDMIYAAALLHDIAKWKQYRDNVDHALEGAVLAKEILKDIGVEEQEAESILDAIRGHRTPGEQRSPLSALLYAGDKSCRLCSQCAVFEDCSRASDIKQPAIEY